MYNDKKRMRIKFLYREIVFGRVALKLAAVVFFDSSSDYSSEIGLHHVVSISWDVFWAVMKTLQETLCSSIKRQRRTTEQNCYCLLRTGEFVASTVTTQTYRRVNLCQLILVKPVSTSIHPIVQVCDSDRFSTESPSATFLPRFARSQLSVAQIKNIKIATTANGLLCMVKILLTLSLLQEKMSAC